MKLFLSTLATLAVLHAAYSRPAYNDKVAADLLASLKATKMAQREEKLAAIMDNPCSPSDLRDNPCINLMEALAQQIPDDPEAEYDYAEAMGDEDEDYVTIADLLNMAQAEKFKFGKAFKKAKKYGKKGLKYAGKARKGITDVTGTDPLAAYPVAGGLVPPAEIQYDEIVTQAKGDEDEDYVTLADLLDMAQAEKFKFGKAFKKAKKYGKKGLKYAGKARKGITDVTGTDPLAAYPVAGGLVPPAEIQYDEIVALDPTQAMGDEDEDYVTLADLLDMAQAEKARLLARTNQARNQARNHGVLQEILAQILQGE